MAPTIPQICRIFLVSILALLNTTMHTKKQPMSNQPKKSAAPVMKENNTAMEVDTATVRNMVVMDTALMVDTDILMEAMVTEAHISNTAEVTENMEEDTEITDTNRIMVEVMAMDIPRMEAMVMEENINRMAKDTEVDTEVTEATSSEVMVAMAVTVKLSFLYPLPLGRRHIWISPQT